MDNFKLRVISAQNALKAPKNQRNTFGGYNYRSCEDILEAAKPVCKEFNLLLNIEDEIVLVGERYYIKATATLMDTESDVLLSSSAYARESFDKKGMDESQITGAASSYARKYALNGLFLIDDTKDSDTDSYTKTVTQHEKAPEKAEEKPAPKPKKETRFLCNSCGSVLKPYTYNGKEIGIRQHAARSEEKYGQVLCLECIAKLYPDGKNES